MKRDLDLIRTILLRVEEAQDYTLRSSDLLAGGLDERAIAQHFLLLDEAGLIDANLFNVEGHGPIRGTANRLTWAGHEFLDATRNEGAWEKTKALVKEKGGGASFEVIKAIATQFSLNLFGLR